MEEQKAEIIALLETTADQTLIDRIYAILHGQEEIWWDEVAEEESWRESEADIAAGEVTSLETVRREFQQWMKE